MFKPLFVFFLFLNFAFGGNVYPIKMAAGEVYVISLQTSALSLDKLALQNEKQKQFVEQNSAKLTPNEHNILLVKSPNFTALVDTGYPHTQKNLKTALGALNVSFEEITHIFITHAHRDHIGGILDEKGHNNFPNAKLMIDKREFDYWQNAGDKRAKDSINSFKEIVYFTPNKPLLEGDLEILAIPAYGHTPGHNMILLQHQGDKLLFWADIMHFYALQIAMPEIAVVFDVDKDEAIKTRKEVLQRLKSEKIQVVGAHMPWRQPIVLE